MTSDILSFLISIFFLGFQASAGPPKVLNVVSNATCQPSYAWMDNAEGKDPCLTVAYVISACVGDTWTQPALGPGESYDSPNGTTATPCYCSWSCYNLMMGCTICQNSSYADSVKTWPTFVQACPSDYTNEKFPQGYVLLSNMSIPYWATINPANWSSELFNTDQALVYASQGQPDYYPSTNSSGTSSGSNGNSGSSVNIGAIIGGTIGGAAALLIVLVGGYFLYKRRKYARLSTVTTPSFHTSTYTLNTHARIPSNPPSSFSPTSSPAPMSYTTTQPQMGTGMSVLSATSYSSFQATSPPPPTVTETASFMTTGNNVIQRPRVIPMV